jgi:hypothetical protein
MKPQWKDALEQAGHYQSVLTEKGAISEFSDGGQDFWWVSSPEAGQDISAKTVNGVNLVLEELDLPKEGWK